MIPIRLVSLLSLAATLVACRVSQSDTVSAADSTVGGSNQRPMELSARWVRLRADGTWGDTLDYRADGHVIGSQGHPVPTSARWGVRVGPPRQICFGDATEGGMCRTYELRGDTLVLDSGPSAPTLYRRVGASAPAT